MTIPTHPYSPAADLSRFWVIAVISNPQRYKRRYELFFPFQDMCLAAGVNLIVVEQAFGDRPFMITESSNPYHIQVRTIEELWHKENMINMGVVRAAQFGAREIAWVDADVRPTYHPRTWFEETWHELQHYEFVQMWENLIDLDLRGNMMSHSKGFMSNYVKMGSPDVKELRRLALNSNEKIMYPYYGADGATGKELFIGHPGGAWAANLDAFNKVGGLIDYAILGSGDHYMAYALLGTLQASRLGVAVTSQYEKRLLAWQGRCEHWIKRDVGFVRGTLLHDYHGPKVNRGYSTRWKILTDNYYDPDTDIKYDAQGMLQLETVLPRQIKLRDDIRNYFRSRNEDSTGT